MSEPTISPFLPGTSIQYAIDSTSIGWMKTCPRLYQYQMIENWRPNEESVHLRFGLEYHQALHDYELAKATGIPHDDAVHDTLHELMARTDDFRPDHKYKNRDNLIRTVLWYLDKFKDDPAQTVILANGLPAIEVTFKFELDWGPWTTIPSLPQAINEATNNKELTVGENVHVDLTNRQPYLLCGHLDRIVNYQDFLFVMDRKTTKSQPSSWYFTQYEPENQMSLYTLAGQVILHSPVKGVIIDAAQIAIDFSRFGRGLTYRTKDQISEWTFDLQLLLKQFEDYAIAGYYPMNDKACNSYRSEESGSIGCPFREICGKSPQVREQFLKSGFTKLEGDDVWNPLKAR